MSEQLKQKLVALVRSRAQSGRGAFQARVEAKRLLPGPMTNDELNRELEDAYGSDVLALLDQAGIAKFYESDLRAVLGEHRARIVLKHRRSPKEPPAAPVAPQHQTGRKVSRKVGGWTTGAATVAAILVVRAFTGGTGEGEAVSPVAEASASSSWESNPASETYEFSSCAQYLGAVSGLRCFSQLGGDRLPADSSDARAARSDIARAIRASRWRRHSQCPLFVAQVDGVSFAEASYEVLPLRDRGSLTQESLYNSCSSSANSAAYEACSSASGMCDEDY